MPCWMPGIPFFVKTIDKHAPIKTNKIKNENQPDWVTFDILDKIKQGDNLKNRANLRIINMRKIKCPQFYKNLNDQYIKRK